MKKMLYLTAAMCSLFCLLGVENAQAQRKNHTKADVAVVQAQDSAVTNCNCMAQDEDCNCQKMLKKKHKKDKEMKKHHKDKEKAHKKKKHHDWLKKELRDIEEKYDEAIEKIEDSSFADHNKEILRQQAQASKDLAIKQAKEINELRMQQSEARKAMADEIAAEKDNRKAIEEISDIN